MQILLYQDWPTPTPLPPFSGTPIPFWDFEANEKFVTIAEHAVQYWNHFNYAFEWLLFAVIIFLVLVGFRMIFKKLRDV